MTSKGKHRREGEGVEGLSRVDLKVVLVRVMLPAYRRVVDTDIGPALAGVASSVEEQECKSTPQSNSQPLKYEPIHLLHCGPLPLVSPFFLVSNVARRGAVHFNLISDNQSSPEPKLTRLASVSLSGCPSDYIFDRKMSDASL